MPAARSAGHIKLRTKEIRISQEEQIAHIENRMIGDLYEQVRSGSLSYPDWPEVTDIIDAILHPQGRLSLSKSECLTAWLCCHWDDPRVAEAKKLRGFENSTLKQVLETFE